MIDFKKRLNCKKFVNQYSLEATVPIAGKYIKTSSGFIRKNIKNENISSIKVFNFDFFHWFNAAKE